MRSGPSTNNNCTLCGKCIDICPKDILAKGKQKAEIVNDNCMFCSHCYDICNFNAIKFNHEEIGPINIKSFKYKEKHLSPSKIDPEILINSIRSRRSIRKYSDQKIPHAILEDLIEFAVTAPSGSNCQDWEFTIINSREKVWDIALSIKNFFVKLNKLAKNPIIRYLSILFAGKTLLNYYKNSFESVEMAIEQSNSGIDRLFHGAPGLIILHSPTSGSTPLEDAQYASYNITLLAHALDLGTCYIGYATESINRMVHLKKELAIPMENKINIVLTIGYPDIEFYNLSLRKNYKSKWFK